MSQQDLAAARAQGKREGWTSSGMEQYGSDMRRCAVRLASKFSQKICGNGLEGGFAVDLVLLLQGRRK